MRFFFGRCLTVHDTEFIAYFQPENKMKEKKWSFESTFWFVSRCNKWNTNGSSTTRQNGTKIDSKCFIKPWKSKFLRSAPQWNEKRWRKKKTKNEFRRITFHRTERQIVLKLCYECGTAVNLPFQPIRNSLARNAPNTTTIARLIYHISRCRESFAQIMVENWKEKKTKNYNFLAQHPIRLFDACVCVCTCDE